MASLAEPDTAGVVSPPAARLVGEKGPELFLPLDAKPDDGLLLGAILALGLAVAVLALGFLVIYATLV